MVAVEDRQLVGEESRWGIVATGLRTRGRAIYPCLWSQIIVVTLVSSGNSELCQIYLMPFLSTSFGLCMQYMAHGLLETT